MSERGLAWSKTTTLESVVLLAASLLEADMTVHSKVFYEESNSSQTFFFSLSIHLYNFVVSQTTIWSHYFFAMHAILLYVLKNALQWNNSVNILWCLKHS